MLLTKMITHLLHTAAFYGQIDTTQCLIEHSADIHAKNKMGCTAYDVAHDKNIKKLLQRH